MTTIAANRRCMAADSCVVIGDMRSTASKIFRVGKVLVATAGNNADGERFLEWLRHPKRAKPQMERDSDFAALVLTGGGILHYEWDCSPTILRNDFYAIGSGGSAAMAAMHCGKSPADAVLIACLVDINSSPPVERLEL